MARSREALHVYFANGEAVTMAHFIRQTIDSIIAAEDLEWILWFLDQLKISPCMIPKSS